MERSSVSSPLVGAADVLPRRLLASAIACAFLLCGISALAQERAATPDLKRARELDQQGVRAFKDGRFKDAITFFSSAFHFGAPPVELWNIAKCHLKLDEPEAAEVSLHQFLEQPDLTAGDRADATRELEELRERPSSLAIDSEPGGATFTIDNSAAARGTTPGSIDIPPGKHHVHVEKEKVGAYDVDVEARLGRALIVQARLGSSSGSVTSNAPDDPSLTGKRVGLVFSEDFGLFLPKLGRYSDSLRPVLHLAARYVFREIGIVALSGGLRFDVTTNGWHAGGSTTLAGTAPQLCAIGNDFLNDELAAFLVGGASVRVLPRVQLGGDLGVGVADFEGSPIGGELFTGDCNPAYGLRPAFHVGTQASFVLTASSPFRVRALLEPILFQAHAAYHGTTDEASGLWWRVGSALGFALDF